jgi:hypothetical protein
MTNYRPISTLNNFSKIFEKLPYMSMFRAKFNPRRHGFIKPKFTATNPVVYLDVINPQVHPQRKVNAI